MRGRTMKRLDRDECIKLMERHPACVGRVALAGPRPVIFPVNYAIDRGNVVFRTDPGSKFDAANQKSYVAFEVDWVEPTWQIGWSVVVRGQARLVTDPQELERVRRAPTTSLGRRGQGELREHRIHTDLRPTARGVTGEEGS